MLQEILFSLVLKVLHRQMNLLVNIQTFPYLVSKIKKKMLRGIIKLVLRLGVKR